MLSCTFAILAAVIASTASSEPAAPPAPTPQGVRAAVQRSLPFIETIATAWMRDRKCNSCHNITFLVWSHNEAAAHGLDVDKKKLEEWTKWSLADSLSDRYWFRIRAQTVEGLKADRMPPALLAKLNPSGTIYTTPKEFQSAMERILGREDLERWQQSLLRRAALPNNGGGPDTLSQILLARGASRADKGENESYDAIRSLLLEWQEPNGAWLTQGQLPALKWAGENEMNEATTIWSLLAESRGGVTDPIFLSSRDRALESLKGAVPGVSIQSLALHAILAHKFGERPHAETLQKDLLGRQNEDGGWGWVKDNKSSDAFATGQALYALGLLGRDGSDPAVQRAWGFLLRTQGKDGSWEVPQAAINTRPRGLNVYTYWGTAWAAIGLLQTLPAVNVSR